MKGKVFLRVYGKEDFFTCLPHKVGVQNVKGVKAKIRRRFESNGEKNLQQRRILCETLPTFKGYLSICQVGL